MVVKDDEAGLDRRLELIKRFVAIRKGRGLTQQDVATRMNVVQGTVQSFESGTDPRMSTIIRYCRAIGADITFEVTE